MLNLAKRLLEQASLLPMLKAVQLLILMAFIRLPSKQAINAGRSFFFIGLSTSNQKNVGQAKPKNRYLFSRKYF